MFKSLFKILKNRFSSAFIEFVMDVLIGTITDWRRAKSEGALDLHRRDPNAFKKESQNFNFQNQE